MENIRTVTLDIEQAKQPDVEFLNHYDRIMIPKDILISNDDNAETIKLIYETLSLTGHEVLYYK